MILLSNIHIQGIPAFSNVSSISTPGSATATLTPHKRTTSPQTDDLYTLRRQDHTSKPWCETPQVELAAGMARRAVGATSHNEHSSRSHALVRVFLTIRRPVLGATAAAGDAGGGSGGGGSGVSDGDKAVTPQLFATHSAMLQLVDLAGVP